MKALKESAKANTYNYDKPNPDLLESFDTPKGVTNAYTTVHIEVPEFTSLCPITGQPDFATIIIDYYPDKLCVESKSLKLYLMGYRNHGAFHEQCVNQIMTDLVQEIQPKHMNIKGEFTPRGGIPFHPTVHYSKP